MKKFMAIILGGTMLVSCSSLPDSDSGDSLDKTAIGAGIGAVGGVISGLLFGNSITDTVISAGVGALAGGAVGLYMDSQEEELRTQLDSSGITITRSGEKIIVNLPANVSFSSGSASLNPAFHASLNSLAQILTKYDKTILDVTGHTDSQGGDAYNLKLSQQRALSVATYVSSQGISSQRFSVNGAGENSPVASNATANGRAANRRVEIAIIPVKQ